MKITESRFITSYFNPLQVLGPALKEIQRKITYEITHALKIGIKNSSILLVLIIKSSHIFFDVTIFAKIKLKPVPTYRALRNDCSIGICDVSVIASCLYNLL